MLSSWFCPCGPYLASGRHSSEAVPLNNRRKTPAHSEALGAMVMELVVTRLLENTQGI